MHHAMEKALMLVTPKHIQRRPASYLLGDYLDVNKKEEYDMVRCCHCSMHFVERPFSGHKRGWCHNCAGKVCGKQACMTRCEPFMRKIEAHERRGKLMEALKG